MGKKSTPAPTPDPLIGQAAQGNVELGRESLAFARQQYEEGKIRQDQYDAVANQVAQSALNSQNKAEAWAQEDRTVQSGLRDKYEGYADEDRATQAALRDKYTAWSDQDRQLGRTTQAWADSISDDLRKNSEMYERQYADGAAFQSNFGKEEMDRYKSTFRPVQDRLANDAMTWDSAERLDSEAAKAKSDVVTNADQQRAANERSMASMGVNPNSGRFAGISRATDTLTALGAAGAQNTARDNARSQGIQLRGQAAQLGQQVLANGQQANQMSMAAVEAGRNARLSGTAAAMQAKNLGLAAAGVGNTSAGLSVGTQASGNAGLGAAQQGAGYTGISSGLASGGAALGAYGSANAGWNANNGIMQGGFSMGMQGNTSGAGIANNLYGNQLNAWNAQTNTNNSNNQSTMQGIGTLAMAAATAY